jgi:dTMP kinase
MFIVFEGIDGSGTTTQLHRVAVALQNHGHKIYKTHEPSNGPIGKLIREVLKTNKQIDHRALALLFAADRVDHITREIKPALNSGAIVLCDRYLGSSLVYQGIFCDPAWVREINSHVMPADLTLVLNVSAEEARRRRNVRGTPIELFDDIVLQTRLAENYQNLPMLIPEHTVQIIDGTRTPDVVESTLVKMIVSQLEKTS